MITHDLISKMHAAAFNAAQASQVQLPQVIRAQCDLLLEMGASFDEAKIALQHLVLQNGGKQR